MANSNYTSLLGSVSALALMAGGAAYAADLPSSAAPAAPPPVVIHTWTGAYFGGTIGASGHNSSADLHQVWADEGYASYYNGPQRLSSTGLAIGIYAGYNWDMGGTVVGVEADISALTNRVSDSFMHVDSYEFGVLKATASALGSVRLRAGMTFGDTLAYLTGGVAFANIKNSYNVATKGILFNASSWRAGWIAGAGVERMINGGWLVRAEVLHARFGNKSPSDSLGYFAPAVKAVFKEDAITVGRIGVAKKF